MSKKIEYVSVSARIPKAAYEEMCEARDTLEFTTNQLVSFAIQDWVEIATSKDLNLPHRLNVARFSLQNKNKKQSLKGV